jgi:hypothetical protein
MRRKSRDEVRDERSAGFLNEARDQFSREVRVRDGLDEGVDVSRDLSKSDVFSLLVVKTDRQTEHRHGASVKRAVKVACCPLRHLSRRRSSVGPKETAFGEVERDVLFLANALKSREGVLER